MSWTNNSRRSSRNEPGNISSKLLVLSRKKTALIGEVYITYQVYGASTNKPVNAHIPRQAHERFFIFTLRTEAVEALGGTYGLRFVVLCQRSLGIDLCLAKTPSALICTASFLLETPYDPNLETSLRSLSLRFALTSRLAA